MDSYNQHFALNILHPSARNLSKGGALQSLLDNFVASKNQLSNNWKLVLIGHKFLCNSLQGLILINLVYNLFGLQQIFEWVMVAWQKRRKKLKFIKQVQKNGGSCSGTPLAKITGQEKKIFWSFKIFEWGICRIASWKAWMSHRIEGVDQNRGSYFQVLLHTTGNT